ncbi:MAG TPA: nucleotidyltransferase domain-containing protein [bacterium]|jgi:predicted nucleotidyltransferase|nr:nucleotidyltransferase domain-containing protein [bacterium]HOB70501.1 nucleotidyltransferase domain-containing protein [bacterium]HOG44797.1 nucleotidyltransferase domain-containing protein [bacterium]HQM83374.1 nucleotidyltransferase domain-containing protein [bacterium]
MNIDKKLLASIIKILKKYDIEKAVLFGSRARGDNRENSDIDIAFYTDNKEVFHFLKDEMDQIDTILKIDLFDAKNIKKQPLLDGIKKDGIIIYENHS